MYGDVLLLMLLKIDCSPGKLLIVCPDADSARTCHMYIFHAEAPGISRYRIVCSCFFFKFCFPHTQSENTHSMTSQCWKWVHHWRTAMTPGGRTGLDLGRPLRPCAGHGVSRLGGGEATKSWGFTGFTSCNETLLELSKNDVSGRILYSYLFMGSEFFGVPCRM